MRSLTSKTGAIHGRETEAAQSGETAARLGLLSVGLICFVLAVTVLGASKRAKWENIRLDARALAEGLRVQFYWAAVGTGESVPANYLERQHTELDWLRNAIRSLAAPYHLSREWFQSLGQTEQIDLLQRASRVCGSRTVDLLLPAIQRVPSRSAFLASAWMYPGFGWSFSSCRVVGLADVRRRNHPVLDRIVFCAVVRHCRAVAAWRRDRRRRNLATIKAQMVSGDLRGLPADLECGVRVGR